MTFAGSAALFALSVVGFVAFSAVDKKTGQDRFRVVILLCGIMGMLALFFLLIHLAGLAKV